ncbi:PilN domain-containing protein [Pseudomonas entomophila]|uniref:PilN domain-containing protein n=1 Tax=Pseudomonas entomophila TaxID=312306 RepID=UPI0023D7DDF8|nr:PilN domain-containing protein [Pseudomonas entomophila]MDF0734053.1 PilN domain-containing protein [Pseudomonas entomophila]
MSVRLNLMPWRERQRASALRRFCQRLVGCLVLALVGVMVVDRLAYLRVQQQARAGVAQQAALQALDSQRQHLQGLAESRLALEAQQALLAGLGASQGVVALLLAELERAMPGGMRLRGLDLQGERLSISGLATSPAVLAQFMRDLVHSDVLSVLELKQVEGGAEGDAFLLLARLMKAPS